MNANNNGNGNGDAGHGREGEAHEIPADPSASETDGDDDARDERTSNINGDDGALPCDGDRERHTNDDGGIDGGGDRGAEGGGGGDEGDRFDRSSFYAANRAPRGNGAMHPNDGAGGGGGGPRFFPPHFDPQPTPFDFDPSYRPLPPQPPANCLGQTLGSNLPPMLPPPPPSLPMAGNPNLDATRQYYEARMREHAMQYANAAAGAAWAAARIACGEHGPLNHAPGNIGMGGMPGGFMGPNPSMGPSYYAPASAPMDNGGFMMGQNSLALNSNQALAPSSLGGARQQKRTLWHPPSSPSESKVKGGPSKLPKKGGKRIDSKPNERSAALGEPAQSATTPPGAQSKPPSNPNNEKKRSKREIRGNDSVSSLGSESRDLNNSGRGNGGNNGKRNIKKGKQRRFNDDAAAPRNDNPVNDGGGDGKDGGGNSNENTAVGGNFDRKDRGGGNLRQKRGLHHGHSSKSSFSSFGSGGGGNGGDPRRMSGGRNKKKGRSQPRSGNDDGRSPSSSGPPASVHLGGLIGKNGARALHELCSKYRWEMPKYNSIEPQNFLRSADNDGNSNTDISFLITVHINGVELGRGRAGTKGSAKQDASRRALAALVPGVVFDPNGILLDVGSNELLLRGVGVAKEEGGAAAAREGGDGSGEHDAVLKGPLSLEELGPHLASQLAIGGGGGRADPPQPGGARSGPASPDHSEDSSISTAVSEGVISGGPLLVSGGPLSHKLGLRDQHASPAAAGGGAGRFFSSNIYPCASTTSGVSSASDIDEIEDENAYYSSRGASVCSTLLHAMWQIDDRIREPPSYVFDLCPSPVNRRGPAAASGAACSKRKKVESPREVAVRMFQCSASLNLYFPRHLGGDKDLSSLMDYWESPLDHLQSKEKSPSSCGKGETCLSRKRKDSFASQSTPSPLRTKPNDCVDEQQEESLSKSPKVREKEKEEFTIQHKLESIGTGSTKRESKHKASAKLLAALFPGCNSMLEVKAEAEAAREWYAANKAAESQTKRAKLMEGPSPERKTGPSKPSYAFSKSLPASPPNQQTHDVKPISLHALSLSEVKEGSKQINWSDSAYASAGELDSEERHLHASFQTEVDMALQSLQELDGEGRSWAARDLSLDDVGKISLRRAKSDDTEHVYALLNKNGTEALNAALTTKRRSSNTPNEAVDADEIDVPASEVDNAEDDVVDEENNAAAESDKRESKRHPPPFGRDSILLVLSRAVAPHDPPLGCAILTLSSSNNSEVGRRNLSIRRLSHEGHLPRERFLECLEEFANDIRCNLDGTASCADLCDSGDGSSAVAVSPDDIRSFLLVSSTSSSPYHHAGDVVGVDCGSGVNQGNPSHSQHLQSVKEEESEEVDDGSEAGGEVVNGSDNKNLDTGGDVGGSHLVKGRPSKPSKRSRVA